MTAVCISFSFFSIRPCACPHATESIPGLYVPQEHLQSNKTSQPKSVSLVFEILMSTIRLPLFLEGSPGKQMTLKK
jgi:hypothetical protein